MPEAPPLLTTPLNQHFPERKGHCVRSFLRPISSKVNIQAYFLFEALWALLMLEEVQ